MGNSRKHRLFPAAAAFAAWLLVAGLVGGVPLAHPAQEPPAGPPPGGPPVEPPPDFERRETARLYLVHRMRQNLELTDAQSLRVMDILEEMEAARREHQETARDLHKRIQRLLDDPGATDGRLLEAVAAFQRERDRFEAALKDLEASLLKVLTPRQQALFIQLRNRLMDPPGERGGPRRGQNRRPG